MSARKIKYRALDRLGKYPRFISGRRKRSGRVSFYHPPLVLWVSMRLGATR